MKWSLVYFIIITASFYGCSSKTSLYDADSPLTKRVVKSTITDLRVNVPRGWFFSWAGTNNMMDIWLTREDYSASITFLPVYFEDQDLSSENNSIKKIFDLVKIKSKSGGNLITTPKDTLTLFNPALAFEFTNTKKELSRVIVFSYNDIYYQCTAIIFNAYASPSEIFAVQNSVLKSAFAFK